MSSEVALWAKTPEACERLLVSRSHLYELRKSGILVEGAHFRYSGAINSPIVWDLGALELALRSLAAPDPRLPVTQLRCSTGSNSSKTQG